MEPTLLIVLVEDDVDLAEVTQLGLEREGLRAAVAHHGREGLELIERLQQLEDIRHAMHLLSWELTPS